jgi:hypothetical protein
MIYLHGEFHIPSSSNGALVVIVTTKTKCIFFVAASLFCIPATSNFVKKNCVFYFKDLLLHKFQNPTLSGGGTRRWLRHYATNWNVAGSSPG